MALNWEQHYRGLPEYNNVPQKDPLINKTYVLRDKNNKRVSIKFKFRNHKDYIEFISKVQPHITSGATYESLNEFLKKKVYHTNKIFDGTQRKFAKQSWYPHKVKGSKWLYTSDEPILPKYPIYVISIDRWERRQTVKTLEKMNCPYRIVVEPSQYEQYASVIDPKKILTLPEDFSKREEGSQHTRNWVWDHSIQEGHDWHWILDDNIESIERFNNNHRIKCRVPTPFAIVEDFVSRYDNIAQAGMHYSYFCPENEARSPLHFNVRVYSCILMKNDLPFRWRGKFNEDTDLSLRLLKKGYATVLFRTFLAEKRASMTQRGGNNDTIYNDKTRLDFAQHLVDLHPDVVKVTKRFNRYHHLVNYTPFENNLLYANMDIDSLPEYNEYGLKLVDNWEKKK